MEGKVKNTNKSIKIKDNFISNIDDMEKLENSQKKNLKKNTTNHKINEFFNSGENISLENKNSSNNKKSNNPIQLNIKNKNDIPFINKSSTEKLDNPKYNVIKKNKIMEETEKKNKEQTEKNQEDHIVKYEKLMEFDAEARKNKDKKEKNNNNSTITQRNKKEIVYKDNKLNLSNENKANTRNNKHKNKEISLDELLLIPKEEDLIHEIQENPEKQKEIEKIKYETENFDQLDKDKIKNNNSEDLLSIKPENKQVDEIDNLLDVLNNKITNDKLNNPRKLNSHIQINKNSKTKTKPVLDENFESIINISEIKNKEKIENSDLLLLIIEICQNAKSYNLHKSSKSKLFWDEVFNKSEIAEIFKNFKSETLRKYWRLISETNKISVYVETIKKFSNSINQGNIK